MKIKPLIKILNNEKNLAPSAPRSPSANVTYGLGECEFVAKDVAKRARTTIRNSVLGRKQLVQDYMNSNEGIFIQSL